MQLNIRNRYKSPACLLAIIAFGALSPVPGWAIALGQVDNFNDGTAMDWFGSDPINLADDGSSGAAGDDALRVESYFPDGAPPRLLAYTTAPRWMGNWTAAGVEKIEFDIRNPNAFDLTIRLGLAGTPNAGPDGVGDTYVSASPVVIPANSGWSQASFDVNAAGWQIYNGSNIAAALANVTHFRILHNAEVDFKGAQVAGKIDLDNIRTASGLVDGDYNGNGVVDAADYTVWRDSQGQNGADLPADGNGDMTVNSSDYSYWKARFANTSGSGTATSSESSLAIPEPGGIVLGLMLLLVAGMWRWCDLRAAANRN